MLMFNRHKRLWISTSGSSETMLKLKVEEIFSFSNGSTVFFCTNEPNEGIKVPHTFHLYNGDLFIGELEFDSFRMATPKVMGSKGVSLSTASDITDLRRLQNCVDASSLYLVSENWSASRDKPTIAEGSKP